MYDGLYDLLGDDVEVAVKGDHPTLNREVAARLGSGERIDLISTHSKYAPSQRQWLMPLDEVLAPEATQGLDRGALDLCRFDGRLLSLPHNIDVRVLWWRTDRLEEPPASWDELAASGVVFGFPGRESGLFGTFFELVVASGGHLFDGVEPVMDRPESVAAVETLRLLARRAPADLPDWHYDQVDQALLDGRVDAAAAWPGGYAAIRDSKLAGVLAPAAYPAGRSRWVSYAGCHSWAIPRTCADLPAAVDLLTRLTSPDAAVHDAAGGSVPARLAALDTIEPAGPVDAERLALTRRTIEEAMITYPPLARFPSIEDAGWAAINAALRGELDPGESVRRIQAAAEEALR
jgi:multiple sugar transport system substrate-binding protein